MTPPEEGSALQDNNFPEQPQQSQSMLPGGSQLNSAEHRQEQQREAEKELIRKQQRWLLFLMHCSECQAPEGHCQYSGSCDVAKALLCHIRTCSNSQCIYPRCLTSRDLLEHHQACTSRECPMCTPVNRHLAKKRTAALLQQRTVIAPEQVPPQLYPNLKAALSMAKAAVSDWEAVLQQGPAQCHANLEAAQALEAARSQVEAALSKVEAEQPNLEADRQQALAQLHFILEAARALEAALQQGPAQCHANLEAAQALEAARSQVEAALSKVEAEQSNLEAGRQQALAQLHFIQEASRSRLGAALSPGEAERSYLEAASQQGLP